MNNIVHLPEITIYHWFLAYAGLLGSLFYRLSLTNEKLTRLQRRKEIYATLAGIVFIPVAFVMLQEQWLKEMFPITNVTALFIGTQSKSIVKAVMRFKKPDVTKLKEKFTQE